LVRIKKKYNEKPEKIKLKCKLCDYKCEIKLGNSNANLNYHQKLNISNY